MSNLTFSFGIYVYYQPTLEAVVTRKEMKTHIINMIILNTSLGMTSQCKAWMQDAWPIPFSALLGKPNKLKHNSKNINRQINVSGLLVFHQLIFMVNLPWCRKHGEKHGIHGETMVSPCFPCFPCFSMLCKSMESMGIFFKVHQQSMDQHGIHGTGSSCHLE